MAETPTPPQPGERWYSPLSQRHLIVKEVGKPPADDVQAYVLWGYEDDPEDEGTDSIELFMEVFERSIGTGTTGVDHAGSGKLGIMVSLPQARLIRQALGRMTVEDVYRFWGVVELDRYMPQLVEALQVVAEIVTFMEDEPQLYTPWPTEPVTG